ncbi:MAG: DUF3152 domain-containing protein [Enhygromyxa sp.]
MHTRELSGVRLVFSSIALTSWLLAARALFELGPEQAIASAREPIHGREFWVLRDPSRPTVPWKQARDRDAIRYRLLLEVGLEELLPSFIATVGAVLDDERGWTSAGREFVRVDAHEHFAIVLARPGTVDRLCKPLRTGGVYSCGRNGRATLNEARWRSGSAPWGEELEGYRVYMINHEVGHLLGMPHRKCHEPGQPAAVMVQQSIGLGGCTAEGWPADFELERLRKRWARD